MNIRNKKNIGILLAAIIVTSVFVGLAPSVISWAPPGTPGKNLLITGPTENSCVLGEEVLVEYNRTLLDYVDVALFNCDTDCMVPGARQEIWCDQGCDNFTMNFSKSPWAGNIPDCGNICIYVWNCTSAGCSPTISNFRNGTRIKMDQIKPCIQAVSPVVGKWYNCSAAIELNVSACDNCCGLKNVTANISLISKETSAAMKEFDNTSTSAGEICKSMTTQCDGFYFSHTIPLDKLRTSCGIKDITVTARDNAIGKYGQSNTATTTLKLGVDCDAPAKVTGEDCAETPGAITLTWSTGVDPCSGVAYYKIYGTHLNTSDGKWLAGGTFYAGKTTGTETTWVFTGAKQDAEYCNYYKFNISAVDNAGNEGVQSNFTEAQHLIQGPPDDIDLWVIPTLEGCGKKWNDSVIKATVKDAYGVAIADVVVCFNTTDGQVCPTEAKTQLQSTECYASVAYTTPKVVLEPYNVTICAKVCSNTSIVECKNILITPKQATGAIITANPTMIATNGSTSVITVQLVDKLGNPVAGSGNQDVTVTTTAGKFDSTGTKTVSGKIAAGKFTATLVSGTKPTLATVSANVGALYFPSTTVAFVGSGSYDISLCKGWNLVSLPLVPENTYAGTVLSGIVGNLTVAYAYDGCTGNWTYGGFTVGGPWSGDLVTMTVLRGYWLLMDTPATLTVTGYTMVPGPFLPPTLVVCPGWNLVGYYAVPPDKAMTAGDYFNDVPDMVSYNMLGYNCESQGYFSVGAGDNLGSGKGYWMNANNYGEIKPQEWL